MNLYPALEASMGSWKYYIIKMTMRELAAEVNFASEVYEDRTLDEAIQRSLKEGRVRKEIVSYLTRRSDRFFSSVVIAALKGSPQFYPVRITDDPAFTIFKDQLLDQSFGILTFSGGQKYYALDGQHRLKAIKTLMDKGDPASQGAPDGFTDEEISVIMIVPHDDESGQEFFKSYRRLFSSLNRYAKSTDADTNIIMDEDDAFAILTRRLVTEENFFRWAGKQKDSPVVKTQGKNLKTGEPYFTSLQTLYSMNRELLSTPYRNDFGWGPGEEEGLEKNVKQFERFRPDEDYLDSLYSELTLYWKGLLTNVPDLSKDPTKMRVHDMDNSGDSECTDHVLFWPIGQELLAKVARRLLDNSDSNDPDNPNEQGVAKALIPLGKMEWRLHESPWRFFLLTEGEKGGQKTWKMRSEDRAEAIKLAGRILGWMVGLDELDEDDVAELKIAWQTRLIPAQEEKNQEEMWTQVENKRHEMLS